MGFQNADTLTTTVSSDGSTASSSTTKTAGEWQYFQDIDVTFSMTGETDGGLSFGASVDLDETTAGTTTDDDHGTTVFVSGGFGTVTMGDTDGAYDWALTETGMGGSIADDHTEHAGYNGNSGLDGAGDGQVLRWNYSVNGFGIAVSQEQGSNGAANSKDITAFGVTYTTDMAGASITLGAGTQDYGVSDRTGFSVKAAMDNGLTVVANMSSGTDAAIANVAGTAGSSTNGVVVAPVAPVVAVAQRDVDTTGLGIGYTMDALTVAVNWGEVDYSDGSASDVDGYGVAINYDLGGGAVAQFGYGSSDRAGGALDSDTMSMGIAMSF
jgi:outer membrane protein OmpU